MQRAAAFWQALGERLRDRRLACGFTHRAAGDVSYIHREDVRRLEKGERVIDVRELMSLALLYRVSLRELLAGLPFP